LKHLLPCCFKIKQILLCLVEFYKCPKNPIQDPITTGWLYI
jgi:hypothetical protein